MRKITAIALLLCALLLGGCSLPLPEALSPTPVPTPEITAEPTPTPVPTPSPTPTPEPTPEPTRVPTPTPVPTPEPTPESVPMTREELDEAMFAADQVCAVAFLGCSKERLNVGAPSLLATGGYNWLYPFLGETRNIQMIEYNGDEIFAVVPRSDVTVQVCQYFLSTDYEFTERPGQVMVTLRGGQPMILRCNTSDTLPNTVLLIDGAGPTVSYIPRLSLADSSLLRTSDRVMDLTIYDFAMEP